MSTATTPDRPSFDPPGPGTWILDSVHVPRPFSRYQAEIHTPNLAEGFRGCARRYGLLLDTLDWRFVNGHAYFPVPPAPETEIPARFQAAVTADAGGQRTQGTSTESSSGASRATTYSAASVSEGFSSRCVSRGGT